MAQGDFNVEEHDNAVECVKLIFENVPKSKRPGLIGELNDLYLYLAATKRHLDAAVAGAVGDVPKAVGAILLACIFACSSANATEPFFIPAPRGPVVYVGVPYCPRPIRPTYQPSYYDRLVAGLARARVQELQSARPVVRSAPVVDRTAAFYGAPVYTGPQTIENPFFAR